jgi:hypothetical protein
VGLKGCHTSSVLRPKDGLSVESVELCIPIRAGSNGDSSRFRRHKLLGPNPSGLCMCWCGRKTKIVTKSDRRHSHVICQPFRFIHGHSRPAAKGPNRFKLRRRTAVIFLERRNGTVLECLISRKDFHRVRRHHWYANKNGKRASYAVA